MNDTPDPEISQQEHETTYANLLLNNFRNAVASGYVAIAVLSMATLDERLSGGHELPSDWKRT